MSLRRRNRRGQRRRRRRGLVGHECGRGRFKYGEELRVVPRERVGLGSGGQVARVYDGQGQRVKYGAEEQVERELKFEFEARVTGRFAVVKHVSEELRVDGQGQKAGHEQE